MLALKRKCGERVRIRFGGVDVWVQVVDCGERATRLCFEAPRDVGIHREELLPDSERFAASQRDKRLELLSPTLPESPR